MENETASGEKQALKEERRQVLGQLEDWLETPMLVLGFVWLALMLWEYVWGLSPLLETTVNVIWIIFILDFAVKFALAPDQTDYLKANWLTAVALAVPALRVFRIFRVVRVLRAARAARGLRLVRVRHIAEPRDEGARRCARRCGRCGASWSESGVSFVGV